MLFDRVAAVEVQPQALPAQPFRIEGLRIEFEVKKDRDRTSNAAEVTIYNLSETSRSRFRKDDRLLLFAGYRQETGPELLFAGDLTSVAHATTPPNVTTKLEAKDGITRARTNRVNLSYSADSGAAQVLQDVLVQFGSAVKAFGKSIPASKFRDTFLARFKDSPYLQGFSFEGSGWEAMQRLARRLKLEISSQNGELKVVASEADDAAPGDEVVLLSPQTGLIGSPERLGKRDGEADDPKKPKEEGWRISALLQPKVEPGGLVALQSASLPRQTQYQVQRVTHKGDTHGRPWETEVEVLDRSAL